MKTKYKCVCNGFETIVELDRGVIPGRVITINNKKFIVSKMIFDIGEGMEILFLNEYK